MYISVLVSGHDWFPSSQRLGVVVIDRISVGKTTVILHHIIRMETVTRMDAELVHRSKEIHERLKQLGDSL